MNKQIYGEGIRQLIRSLNLKRYEEYAYIFDVFTFKEKPIAFAVGEKDCFKFLMLELKSSKNAISLLGRIVYVGSDMQQRKHVKKVMSLKRAPEVIKRRLRQNIFAQNQVEILIRKAMNLRARNASKNDFLRFIDDLKKVISLGFGKVSAWKYAESIAKELGEIDSQKLAEELAEELDEELRKLIEKLEYKLEWIENMSSPLRCDNCGTILKGVKKSRGRGRKPFLQTEEIVCPKCGKVFKIR